MVHESKDERSFIVVVLMHQAVISRQPVVDYIDGAVNTRVIEGQESDNWDQ